MSSRRVLPVGEVEHPQQRHLGRRRSIAPPIDAVQPAPAELRLALRVEVLRQVRSRSQHVEDARARRERVGERLGRDEVEVVGGGVVLGVLAVRRAAQPADRQVETG